jgi:hypothetical protein
MAKHRSPAPAGKVPTGAVLTKHLREMAQYVETLDDEGNAVTKARRLAALVWDHALGFEEKEPDSDKVVLRRPEQWAIMLIYERIEGRCPVAQAESSGKTVAEKVSELGVDKINALLDKAKKEKP